MITLLRAAVSVHRRRLVASNPDRSLFHLLWETAISAAATSSFDLNDIPGRAYLIRLLWAIEEDTKDLVAARGQRSWVLNLRCWRAILRLARREKSVFPGPLIALLRPCIEGYRKNADMDMGVATNHDWEGFIHAVQSYLDMYIA